jgi:BA14K-like protein/outer membrane protein with glycine zipper
MIPKFAVAVLLALAVVAPAENAAAQDPLGGAIFGGAAGAIVGGALGGGRGAAVGAIVGATTGAAIAAQGERRPGGYYYYQNGCYVQRPDGAWVAASPRYCATAEYAPPVDYGAPECTRYRSYDPRSGTYVGRDGYRRPCP